ncbi:hypothetical protein AVEN_194652-1 [Araneus ventricosus]|uniref:Uncharacterized protein n=1 Tax=Araneus ventricosus TaxID=182803 RepID=A0A4Y2A7E8_ARAVE|nr:hypothetical protein AVEN_194652-1 [Araneus ventricosus]
MATDYDRTFRTSQQRTPNGHNIYCLISVQSLVARQTWPCTLNFSSNCHVFPTTWTLGIVYRQVQETGRFSCSVTLRRNDSLNILVNAHVLVSFVNRNGRVIRFQQTIFNDPILPDHERQGSIYDALLPAYLRFLNSQDIELQVTIFFRSCHSTRNFQPITLTRLKHDENRRRLVERSL